jgi:hypoxanthine phosphoribosyltransferase
LKVAALLDKPSRRKLPLEGDYIGFKIPDEFVVGYGLDYAEKYRNLADICVVPRE